MTLHVLFICSKNRLRSPTAEQVFACWPGVETSSAGLNRDADNPVTPEAIAWAQLIFVMERTHQKKLQNNFKPHLRDKRIICLGIADDYEFMDETLIQILQAKVSGYLPAPPNSASDAQAESDSTNNDTERE